MSTAYTSSANNSTNAFTDLIIDTINAGIGKSSSENRRLFLSDDVLPRMQQLFVLYAGDDDTILLEFTDQTAAAVKQYARDCVTMATQDGKELRAGDVLETTIKHFTSRPTSKSSESGWPLRVEVPQGWGWRMLNSSGPKQMAARAWIEGMMPNPQEADKWLD